MPSRSGSGDNVTAVLDAPTVVTAGHDADAPRAAEAIGAKVGRYFVVDHLGQGGMGRVVRAYDPKLRREVALKLLRATSDRAARARIVREAQAMAALAHPNLVAVHDVDTHEGQPFIAMELVDGTTLRGWARKPGRSWRARLRACVQAGRGLAAAHAAGLVHRDFKPENVLVGTDDRVRVTDFGLARGNVGPASSVGDDPLVPLDDALTMAGSVMGTPAYMAPEQHRAGTVDARSDQYAYCVSVWELLYGQRPFAGKVVGELADAKHTMAIEEPAASRAVPRFVRRVLLRGLAPDPDDRYPSMDRLLAALSYDPSRRRWALAATGLVGIGLATWWGLAAWQRTQQVEACAAAGAAIEDSWNEQRRAAVAEAFSASGLPYADDTFARATPWLDRYADQWQSQREQACLVEHELAPGTVHALQTECLDDRRAALDAVVTAFLQDKDGPQVRQAVTSAAQLPRLAQCSDPVYLAGHHAGADGPVAAQVRERIIEASALRKAGQHEDAWRVAEEARRLAVEADDQASMARASLAAAEAAVQRSEYEQAQAAFEASFSAASAVGLDFVALDAAEHLAYQVGDLGARHEAGLAWGRVAMALVERVGATEDPLAASVNNTVGGVHQARGALDEALPHYERALRISEGAFGPEHPEVAKTLTNIATTYQELAQYDRALPYFERALATYEAVFGPDHPELTTVLNNLGNLHIGRSQAEEAISVFDRARGILGDARTPMSAAIVYNLGNAYGMAGRDDEALAMHRKALEVWREVLGETHPNVGLALGAIATSLALRGEIEESLASRVQALTVLEAAHGREHPDTASAIANLCSTHMALGDDARAEPLCLEAVEIWGRVIGPEHPKIAGTLTNLGTIARRRGDLDQARERMQTAIRIVTANDGSSDDDLVLPLQGMGEVALASDDAAAAQEHFARAVELLTRLMSEPNSRLVDGLTGLARAQLAGGDLEAAEMTLQRAHELATKVRTSPTMRADLDFARARAAWAAGDRGAARRLAEEARAAYVGAGRPGMRSLAKLDAEVERWSG